LILSLIAIAWYELSVLRCAAVSPTATYPADPFDRSGVLIELAHAFADGLRAAAKVGSLHVFDVTSRAAALRSRIAAKTGVIRALVGVLILGGLLVTLFNLQNAVQTLGKAFDTLSKEQASASASVNGSVSAIQSSMGAIAGSAHQAFLFSGIIIALAVIALIAVTALQRHAVIAANAFSHWANRAYLAAWSEQRPTDETAKIQELGNVIKRMDTVVSVLASLGQSMTSISEMGMKLDESTSLIAKAVERLPENVKASVSQLSNEVASQISDDLQHQTQNISRILAIYGEQEIRVKMLHDTLTACEQHIKSSSASLSGLGTLPQKIDTLARAIEGVVTSNAQVSKGVDVLDARVAALPLVDMSKAARSVEAGMSTLEAVGRQVTSLTSGIEGLVKDWHRELEEITPEVARQVSQKLDPALGELTRAVQSADNATLARAIDVLSRIVAELAAKLDKTSRGQDFLDRMDAELKQIHSVVNEPIWKRLTTHR
jgi:hypothetical protein